MIKKNELIKRMVEPISYFNKLIKKKDIILLYSNLGFRDNIKAVYDYLIENEYNSRYRIVFAIKGKSKYTSCNIENVKWVGVFGGLLYFLRAKYVFYCFGKYPIMPSKQQMVVHMWHGMPMKKIGNYEDRNKGDKYDYFTYVLATSEFFKPIMAKAFNCGEKRVLVCGQPKTDDLGTRKDIKKIFGIDKYKKCILWMPTYRVSDILNDDLVKTNENGLPIFDSSAKLEKLNSILKNKEFVLYIKLHPIQKITDIVNKKYSNIYFIDENKLKSKEVSLYEFVSCADAMISDYSSSYMDFLIMNRPVCFTVDDFEEYAKTRGFAINNPLDIMPGKLVYSENDIYDFIEDLNLDKDDYSSERNRVCNLLNKYPDFENAKRLLDMCGIKKGKN